MKKELSTSTRFGARSLTVEVLSTYEAFRDLKDEWNRLCENAIESIPMVTHAWLEAWWTSFSDGRSPYIILVRRGDQLVGAAPFLYEQRKVLNFNCRVLRPWVNSWVDRFVLPIMEPAAEVIDAIFHHLDSVSSTWDFIEFPRLDECSPTATLIRQSLIVRHFPFGIEDDIQSPYLRLPPSWQEVLQGLSSSFRQNIKRKHRAFDKQENTRLTIRCDKGCIDPVAEISLESWQHDGLTSIASRPEILNFYTRIIHDYANSGNLRCALLEIDNEPAAFELNLKHRHTLHNLKLGFKKKFSDLSTGIILKAFVLQEAMEREKLEPIKEYDFMGIAERYKLQWAKSVREHQYYVIFANRPGPRLIHRVLYVMKPVVRERFPESFALLKRTAGLIRQTKSSFPGSAGFK